VLNLSPIKNFLCKMRLVFNFWLFLSTYRLIGFMLIKNVYYLSKHISCENVYQIVVVLVWKYRKLKKKLIINGFFLIYIYKAKFINNIIMFLKHLY